MYQLQKTKNLIQQALHAHQAVTDSAELEKLSYRLYRWWRECRVDHGNTTEPQYQLLQILIETCVTAEDHLTQLVAHRLLADCFSHLQISRYLQENDSIDVIKTFAQTYHPTKAYTQMSPLPASYSAAIAETFSQAGIRSNLLSLLDTTSLLHMRETRKNMNGIALLQLFSRTDNAAQTYQRKLIKLWLRSGNSWQATLNSLHLSPNDQAILIRELKKRFHSATQSNTADALLYSALFAKINPSDQAETHEDTEQSILVTQGFFYDDEGPGANKKTYEYLFATSALLTDASRQEMIRRLTVDVEKKRSDAVAIRTLANVAFHQTHVTDSLIETITKPLKRSGWSIHDAIADALHILLPKLSQEQVDALFEAHYQPRLSDAIPGSGLRIIRAIRPRLSQDQVDILALALTQATKENTNKTDTRLIAVSVIPCYQAVATQVRDRSAILTSLNEHKNEITYTEWRERYNKTWLHYLTLANYPTWLEQVETYLHKETKNLFVSLTLPAASIGIIPAFATQKLQHQLAGKDYEENMHACDAIRHMNYSQLPASLAQALINLAHRPEINATDSYAKYESLELLADFHDHLSPEQRADLLSHELKLISTEDNPDIDSRSLKLIEVCIQYARPEQSIQLAQQIVPLMRSKYNDNREPAVRILIALIRKAYSLPSKWIDQLIASEATNAFPIWEAVANKLTTLELEQRLQQLINLINRPDTNQNTKAFACQLLAKMGTRLNSDQCNRAETALRELADKDDAQTTIPAIMAGCQLYINTGMLNDVSIDLILCAIKYQRILSAGNQVNHFITLIQQLNQIIPQLTPSCLAMLTQAGAEMPLKQSDCYQAFLFTANKIHSGLQSLQTSRPSLGGGGGGGGGGGKG